MLALLAGVITGIQTNKMVTMQVVFLRPVSGIAPLTPHVHEVTLGRHLQGLQSLWESGKAVAVGPMDDPEYAGIAVLDVRTKEEAQALIQNDPFIKLGQLRADIMPWMCENTFKKGQKFLDVEKIWFGILQRPINAPKYSADKLAEMQKGHLANIQKMADDGLLAAAGPFLTDEKRRGIFVFFTKDRKQIESATSIDPLIRAKRLEMKLIPWWTSKGTIVRYEVGK